MEQPLDWGVNFYDRHIREKYPLSVAKINLHNAQPGQLLVAGCTLLAVLVAFLFYDHPITDNFVLLTFLQGAFSGAIQ